jgi:cbb3-type cytochrome oxidase subunit 3
MKNLDIILFTVAVILCFVTFIISTFRAFEKINYDSPGKKEKRGIITRLLNYLESLT